MRRFFEMQMNARNASRGRWRTGLTEAEQREVNAEYERAVAGLVERGYASGELLRRAYGRLG